MIFINHNVLKIFIIGNSSIRRSFNPSIQIKKPMRAKPLFITTIAALIATTLFSGYAYAQGSIIENTTALITASSALLGSLGGIIVAVVGYVANRTKGNAISANLKKTLDDLEKVGMSLQKTDKWVLENEGNLATLIKVVSEMSPDVKKTLQDKNLEIKRLEEEITKAKQELDTIYDTVIPKIKTSN